MRRILGLTIALTLALTGTAVAHTDYTNVTFTHPPSAYTTGSFSNLACWQQLAVYPGQTVYVRNHNFPSAGANRFGLGEFSYPHIHPATGEDNFGSTRRFHFPGGTQLGTRTVYRDGPYGVFIVVKMVNDVGSRPIVARANC